ncbi:P element homolog (lu-p1 element) [Plakobranchus ocellatus]|uniref:P element homolog (Lu-p1 element) n=1 Tax=Plakobranchus ocellatus TaxID=259542 RepID=A0AAV3Y754_9GAST|nr:P element homolog (lu-p1 element) [Plakobranchus ocellatus]
MLINSTISDEDDIKYLLSIKLNEDCLENLFAAIRSKGRHRNKPDPQKCCFALRQVMVDKMLSSIRGTNCKKYLDTFYLNFTSSASEQPPTLQLLPLIHPQSQEQAQVINLVVSQGRRHCSTGECCCLDRGLHEQETDPCCMRAMWESIAS